MKPIFVYVLALVTFSACAQSRADFTWLEGTWKRTDTKPGQSAFEVWELKGNNLYKGMGVAMKGTDTVFVEKLSIIQKDGDYNYVAEVASNAAPTYFKMTSISENGFVSENPNHDFPKKITYQLDGDKLTATISGNGQQMSFSFVKE